MDVRYLKQKIVEEGRVSDILQELGCPHIRERSGMVQAANVDGDNPTAICVYLNDNLTTINWTRQILPENQQRTTDLLDLVVFVKQVNFFQAIKWVCSILGMDYYEEEEELPPSMQFLTMLRTMNAEYGSGEEEEDNTPLEPINPKILTYYLPWQNKMWEDDGISLQTQKDFSVMYDPKSNRIILPFFDPLGTLVGIKGRLMKKELDEGEQKYIYMQNNFNKSKFLFGLDKTLDMITQQRFCPIFEGEKSVMIAYEHGIGSVAVCGSKISKCQASLLTRLNVPLVICFDKDKTSDEVKKETEMFIEQVPLSYMLDKDDILGPKEAPVDNWDKWNYLFKNNIYKLR